MVRYRLVTVGIGGLVGALVVLAGPAAPASAHAELVSSDPPAGSVVATMPSEVALTFSEPVQPVVDKIQVVAPDGTSAAGARPRPATTAVLRIPLRQRELDGTYLVIYRAISDDGHPIVGLVTFSVGAPSATPPIPVNANAAAVGTGMRTAMGVFRYLAVAGLILVLGPMLFLLGLWPNRLSRRGPGRVVLLGAGLLALGTLGELYLQAPYGSGSGPFDITGDSLREALVSRWGVSHLVRLAILAAAVVPAWRVIAGRAGRVDRLLLLVLAVLGLETWPFAGHPGTSSVPAVTVVADTAHLGAIAVWLGGLVILFGFLLRLASERELGVILPTWSRWAQRAVLVLVLAGVTEAVVEVRGFGALVNTSYGRLVLAKVAVLAAVLAVAAYSSRLARHGFTVPAPVEAAAARAHASAAPADASSAPAEKLPAPAGNVPALATTGSVATGSVATGSVATASAATASAAAASVAAPPGDRAASDQSPPGTADRPATGGDRPAAGGGRPARTRLRRSVLLELAGTLVVLGVAMALVQTAPAVTPQAAKPASVAPLPSGGVIGGLLHMANLQSPTYTLQVHVDPGEVGLNHIHLYAYTRAGAPLKVLTWEGTAQSPVRGAAPVAIPLTKVTDNHATANVTLPRAGTWRLKFTLTAAGAEPTSVSGTLSVQ